MKGLKLLLILIVIALTGYVTTNATAWEKGLSFHEKGLAYSRQGNYVAAIEKFKMAVNANPSNADYQYSLGLAYSNNKQFAEAVPHFKKAAELWNSILHQYMLGFAYHDNKQYQEAIDTLRRVIELELPTGLAVMIRERLSAAYASLGQTHNSLGYAHFLKKEFNEAAQAFNKAVGLEPKNVILISRLALSYYKMGRYDDALSAVNKAISLQVKTVTKEIYTPEAATSFGIRGLIYRAKGNSNEAMKDAEKAMGLDPDNPWARFSYGTACLDKGRYDEGVKVLEGEIKNKLPVLNAQWLIAKAMLYVKQGKTKELLDTYFEISEEAISPKNVPAWNDRKALLLALKPIAQAHRENARKFEEQGRFQEALNELARVFILAADDKEAGEVRNSIFQMIRKMPHPPEISEDARKYTLRAEILIEEGDHKGAISETKKAIRLAPFSAKLYFNAALIYGQLKNYSEAIRYMKIYLQAAPDAPNARAAEDEIIKWELLMERGT